MADTLGSTVDGMLGVTFYDKRAGYMGIATDLSRLKLEINSGAVLPTDCSSQTSGFPAAG